MNDKLVQDVLNAKKTKTEEPVEVQDIDAKNSSDIKKYLGLDSVLDRLKNCDVQKFAGDDSLIRDLERHREFKKTFESLDNQPQLNIGPLKHGVWTALYNVYNGTERRKDVTTETHTISAYSIKSETQELIRIDIRPIKK